jgi:hypothetical protein
MQDLNTNYDNLLKRQNALQQVQIKTSCSWCYNGSKNKKIYSSHCLKNNKGEITCPKLLKSICRNCGKSGHVMGKFCLEAQKRSRDLLPAPRKKFIVDRCSALYTPGDSDYFPLSSDDEEDDDTEVHRYFVAPEIKSTNANPKTTGSMRTFLQPKEVSAPNVVPITWASKLFAKPNDA